MNFFEAIQSGFSNYTNFKGRATRSEHNYWCLFAFLVGGITGLLDISIGYDVWEDDFTPMSSISGLILLLPNISVVVRRLHDINKSGWNYWWVFTCIGIIPLFYWCFFKKGTDGENFYGSDLLDKKDTINFDNISKLEKLANLKERGHLTEEEYNEKKNKLL